VKDIGAGTFGCVIAVLDPTGRVLSHANYTETDETIDMIWLVRRPRAAPGTVYESPPGNSVAPRRAIPYI
jgi:hypothetical protein